MSGFWIPLLAGAATGVLSAWGIGGGTLLLLVMTLLLGVEPRTAQGINLLYFLPTAGMGLLYHRKNGLLDRELLRRTVPWGLLAAAGGALLVVGAGGNVPVGAENVIDYCLKMKKPLIIFINGMDKENADYAGTVAALREKYKDNPQLLNSKMMELYREEKVNPFGGCLPILLQIPVFFALYATLDGAVQLRQVSFLWAKDLAAADTVAKIPLYFYDLPINPLVLMMTALMMIQQRMTPMAMDPMQKKMMLMMPVVMLIFLYDLPSGLTLYWTVSNFFSIIQLKLQQKAHPVAAVPVKNAN